MLVIRNVDAGYGKKQVLFGVSMEITKGEVVAVIGPNGAGKSTVLKVAFGLIHPWSGDIQLRGQSQYKANPRLSLARGLTLSAQGERVFRGLTVAENIALAVRSRSARDQRTAIQRAANLFPALKDRMKHDAGTLSGGEQQMVSLARSLATKPSLLFLDEPSLGLAPDLVREILHTVRAAAGEDGSAVAIVEHKVREVLSIADRVVGLRRGKVVLNKAPSQVTSPELKDVFLG